MTDETPTEESLEKFAQSLEAAATGGAEDVPEPGAPVDEAEAQSLAEAEAIAAAMMIGQKMRREYRTGWYFYGKRIGLFLMSVGVVGLIFMWLLIQQRADDVPWVGIFFLAACFCAGMGTYYWAQKGDTSRDEF